MKWKTGLKNKVRPENEQPCVVIEVLDEPFFNTDANAASAYFREPLDLLLGIWVPGPGEIVPFYFDKRRFEPFDGAATT